MHQAGHQADTIRPLTATCMYSVIFILKPYLSLLMLDTFTAIFVLRLDFAEWTSTDVLFNFSVLFSAFALFRFGEEILLDLII